MQKELWLWWQRSLHQLVDGKWIAHAAPSFLDVTGAVVLAADDIWLTIDTLGDDTLAVATTTCGSAKAIASICSTAASG